MAKKKMSLERKTRFFVGFVVALLAVLFVLASLDVFDPSPYFIPIIGFVLTGVILFEAKVFAYVQEKKWNRLSFGDFVVWISALVAGAVLINSLLLLPDFGPSIVTNFPTVASFIKNIAALVGGVAGLMALVYMLTPELKS